MIGLPVISYNSFHEEKYFKNLSFTEDSLKKHGGFQPTFMCALKYHLYNENFESLISHLNL